MSEVSQFVHISPTQKRIHWTTVLFLIVVFVAAVVRGSAESKIFRTLSLNIHELFGLGVLALAVVRIFLVATGKRSSIIRGLVPRAGHTLIYLTLLYQPLIGVLAAQATGGKALNLFSLQIPQYLPADEDFSTALLEVHGFIGWAFLAIIVGHIAMAIWHVHVQGDQHAREMMPEIKNINKGEK